MRRVPGWREYGGRVCQIIFAGHNDEIRISHNVTRPDIDPDILGAGFHWLMTKRNGFYGLPEVLAG